MIQVECSWLRFFFYLIFRVGKTPCLHHYDTEISLQTNRHHNDPPPQPWQGTRWVNHHHSLLEIIWVCCGGSNVLSYVNSKQVTRRWSCVAHCTVVSQPAPADDNAEPTFIANGEVSLPWKSYGLWIIMDLDNSATMTNVWCLRCMFKMKFLWKHFRYYLPSCF